MTDFEKTYQNYNPRQTALDEARALLTAAAKAAMADGALPEAELPAFIVEIPADVKNGDIASNIAMAGARTWRKAPKMIADALIAHLPDLTGGVFAKVEVAGPGFINLFLAPSFWAGVVLGACANKEYGRTDHGKGAKYNVEFVSANPTGPMHMGNARGGALGDCLAAVLDWSGYDVTREFYINDAGNQIQKFGKSLAVRYLQKYCGEEAYPLPAECYQGGDIKVLAGEFAELNGDKYVASCKGMDEETLFESEAFAALKDALVAYALPKNIAALKRDLGKYRIDYDVWFHESTLHESGAVLEAEQLRPYYQQPRVLGLAELMNSYGTVRADEKILQKICDCTAAGKRIDGHAPFLSGEELNAYIAAGVQSDHECSDIHEAMEKLRRGQYIMVREGTAAQNMDSLLPLFQEPYCSRCMLVTDDKHPGDLLQGGHIDYIIRKAIAAGVDPVVAVRMGTLVPCQYFGLAHSGAVAPGYTADLIVLSDLEKFTVEQVYKKGKLVAQQGRMLHPAALTVDKARFARVFDSFNMDEITPEQLQLKQTGTRQRVICLTPHALLTTEKIVPFCQHPGTAPGVDVAQKIVKLAVFERHHRSGHVGLGFLGNYGLQCGAVASSIAHDSHNLIVAGTNDADMVLAGNTVRKNKGGLAFALNGQVVGELPLPVAGLMSTESAETVEEKLQALKAALKAHGISEDIDAFMTLAFVSLPVIPKLRLNTYGIVDVDAQRIVPAVF